MSKEIEEELKEILYLLKEYGDSDSSVKIRKAINHIEALTKEKQDLINLISDRNIQLINIEKENEELRNKINESNYIIQLFVKGVNSLSLGNGASFKKPYLLAKELLKILKIK